MKYPNFAVNFGGGGAGGFSHIGAVKVMEERHMHPEVVIGSSAGAIIGASSSIGKSYCELSSFLQDEEENIDGIIKPSVSKLWEYIIYKKPFFDDTEKLEEVLDKYFHDKTFDDAPRLNILATNAKNLELVVMNYKTFPGFPLKKAIAISSRLPILFPEAEIDYNGEHFEMIDGGLSKESYIERVLDSAEIKTVFDFNLMTHWLSRIMDKIVNHPEYQESTLYRHEKGFEIVPVNPKIPPWRFINTSGKNIRYLIGKGSRECIKVMDEYESRKLRKAA